MKVICQHCGSELKQEVIPADPDSNIKEEHIQVETCWQCQAQAKSDEAKKHTTVTEENVNTFNILRLALIKSSFCMGIIMMTIGPTSPEYKEAMNLLETDSLALRVFFKSFKKEG